SSPSASSSTFLPFAADFGTTIATLVGRFVAADMPSSARDVTKTYGIPWSSHKTGMCEITSIGEMSPARTTTPLGSEIGALAAGIGDLRSALTTSLTPRLRHLFTAARGK